MMNEQLLGFGFMRLPVLQNGTLDSLRIRRLADSFLESGFRWFDTARPYHGEKSEAALRDAVVKRHPRTDFLLADKLSQGYLKDGLTAEAYFQAQRKETFTEYFDRYLLHAMDKTKSEEADRLGLWDFLANLKKRGLARSVGFSFHDNAETLDSILRDHPWVDFVQLQINYIDWDSSSVQSRLCYETARKHGKDILVMEPVKGGMLAGLPPDAKALLGSDASPASWALRFAASLPGVVTVLSGMSDEAQLQDNLMTMKDFSPLTEKELDRIRAVKKYLASIPLVPCTRCGYCAEACPKQIPISNLLAVLNNYRQFGATDGVKSSYNWYTRNHAASECVKCGACMKLCPQHLAIPDFMGELTDAGKQFHA